MLISCLPRAFEKLENPNRDNRVIPDNVANRVFLFECCVVILLLLLLILLRTWCKIAIEKKCRGSFIRKSVSLLQNFQNNEKSKGSNNPIE